MIGTSLQAVALLVSAAVVSIGPHPTASCNQVPLGLDQVVPGPPDNPMTRAKVELGRSLFFDERLSRNRTISCASCHDPERAFTDGQPVAVGIHGRRGTRNSPTVLNRAYSAFQFWDGRRTSLEEQTLDSIQNPLEMDLSIGELERRLRADAFYNTQFESVFGNRPDAASAVNAITTFVRMLLSGNSAFDRFTHGDRRALSAVARRGLSVFR